MTFFSKKNHRSKPRRSALQSKARAFDRSIFDALRMAYQPFMKLMGLTLLCGFVGRFLLLANTNVIGFWVDSLIDNKNASTNYLNYLILCVVGGFSLTLVFRVLFSNISALAVSQLYDETTLRASRFPMRFFDQTPVGRVVTRFSSDYGNVFRLFGGPLAEFLSILFDLICMFILIGVANVWFLPWMALFAALHYFVYRSHRGNLRESRRALSSSRSPSVAHFAETVQGSSTIRTFSKEPSFIERFEKLDSLYLKNRLSTVKSVLNFSLQMNVLTATLFLTAGLFSVWMVQKGLMTVGSVGVAFGLITLSGNTILMFFDWLAQVEEALIGVERMNGYLTKEIEKGSALPPGTHFATNHPVQKLSSSPELPENAEVRIEGLSFSYAPELPLVLKDLTFTVHKGERLGIIGRTGSGKSTITQALLHLYPFLQGQIKVNGLKPHLDLSRAPESNEVGLEHYRRFFSYIPQEPILFRGPVRDNLDFEHQHSEKELIQALKTVGLDFLASKEGLKIQVEEKAKNFSFGEKQLLCLARALVQKAPILLMDEATSSIDPQSEEILVRATDEFFKGRTQILIAHRLSTLQNCDRILWLSQGVIKGLGRPSEIIPAFQESDLTVIVNGDETMVKNADGIRQQPDTSNGSR